MNNLTNVKLEEINKAYKMALSIAAVANTHNLEIKNSVRGATIFAENWRICEVKNIDDLIEELTALKKAITDATGFY